MELESVSERASELGSVLAQALVSAQVLVSVQELESDSVLVPAQASVWALELALALGSLPEAEPDLPHSPQHSRSRSNSLQAALPARASSRHTLPCRQSLLPPVFRKWMFDPQRASS